MRNKPYKMPPGSVWTGPELLFDERISGNDLKVFLGLCSFANAETDKAFVSQEKLAEKIHMSKKTVNTCLQNLEDCGYIKKRTRGRKNARGRTTSEYTILNKTSEEQSVNFTHKSQEDTSQSVKSTINSSNQSTKFTFKDPIQSVNVTFKENSESTDNSALTGENLGSNKNYLNTNKNNNYNNTHTKQGDKINQNLLFDLPEQQSKLSPVMILNNLREGKEKSIQKIEFVLANQLDENIITDLDLCYFYQYVHKEILGYTVSVNKTEKQARGGTPSPEYMQNFRIRHSLSMLDTVKLIPKILSEFKAICESEGRKKSEWRFPIGCLMWNGYHTDIARIMNKVKPKVNTKYLDNSDTEYTGTNPYRQVDEVF